MKDLRGQEVKHIKENDLKKLRLFFLKEEKFVIKSLIDIGVNIALRASDLRMIKFEDIDHDWNLRIKERKTKKYKRIKFNTVCKESIMELKKNYIKKGILPKGYLFKSFNRSYLKLKLDRPISLVSINRYLKIAQKKLNINYPIGTHSFRKTWGYTVYAKTKDIAIIMKVLNHSSLKQTMKYIGIEQENIDCIYRTIKI
ncbi:tyrosine-type recombinase/integrase [Fusobacterium ulcerans]|uniref:tyrosine-type recombinase/integrase n=1 Tax=Fusobacterium ulcerans TaxID=861 RepID=UPI0030AECA62